MAKKPRENLVYNVQVRQSMLDGQNELAAFQHLAKLAALLAPNKNSAPPVNVSAWTVAVLAKGWDRYVSANGELTLGQAFGLESNQGGGHRSVTRNARYEENLDLAHAVEDLMDKSHSKTAAIAIVAAANNRTVEQLTKALRRPTASELTGDIKRLKALKDV